MMELIKNLLKWQFYVYYLVLTGWVFFTHWLTDILGIEKLVVDGIFGAWIILFLFYAVLILIGDLLIKFVFASLPKKYRASL